MNVRDFGALGNGTTDDAPAFEAAITAMSEPTMSNRGKRLEVPPGDYFLSRSLRIRRGLILEGEGGGSNYGGARLFFPAGVDGLVVDRWNTSPDGGSGETAIIRDVAIYAQGKTTPAHGIRMYASCRLENVFVYGFSGNGIHIVASFGGAAEPLTPWACGVPTKVGDRCLSDGKFFIAKSTGTTGNVAPSGVGDVTDGGVTWGYVAGTNANRWRIDGGRVNGCGGSGLYVRGADSNAGLCIGLDSSSNGLWGVDDEGFLGNTYVACHTATNGAGAYRLAGPSARHSLRDCYSESDQPPSYVDAPSSWSGGLLASGVVGSATGIYNSESVQGRLKFYADNGHTLALGNVGPNGVVQSIDGVAQLRVVPPGHVTVDNLTDMALWNFANVRNGWGFATADESSYGVGPRKRRLQAPQLFTYEGMGLVNEGSRIAHTSTPTTKTPGVAWLEGDVVFNRDPVPSGYVGWVCVAAGENGDYLEGLTATADGTNVVTLSGPTNAIGCGHVLTIGGVKCRVAEVSTARTALKLDTVIPTGTNLPITYVAPTFKRFGAIEP